MPWCAGTTPSRRTRPSTTSCCRLIEAQATRPGATRDSRLPKPRSIAAPFTQSPKHAQQPQQPLSRPYGSPSAARPPATPAAERTPATHPAQGTAEPDLRVQGPSRRLWIPTSRAARAWLCLFACFCGMLLRFARARVEPKSVCVRTFCCVAWTITRVSCGPRDSSWAVFRST